MAKSSNQRATLSSLPLSQSTPKRKSTTTYKPKSWLKNQPPPPIYRPSRKDQSTPYTRSYNSSPHRGILVNTWSSPSDDRASIGPSRPPNASTSIMPRVARFEASQSTRIPSLPAEPLVLVLWLNQVTPTVLWRTVANPADSVQPPRQSHSWLGRHVVPARCRFCG
jgi:hypothetical protein